MANYNKVLLMGNLTRDPELRYPANRAEGSAICKFAIAVNRQWRDAAGNQQEEVCFVDIVVFGRQAETSNEYLRKGRPVFIEGHLHFDQWDDRETGKKRSRLEVVGERVQFLGSPQGAGGGAGGGGGAAGAAGAPPRERAPAAAPATRGAPAAAPAAPRAPPSRGAAADPNPL